MTKGQVRDQGRRLLRLVRLLEGGEALTARQIAERLGCSMPKVRQDVKVLRDEGWDVSETAGRPKKFFLAPKAEVRAAEPVQAIISHALLRMLHHHAPTPSHLYHAAALALAAGLPERPRELALQSLGPAGGNTSRILETVAAAWCWGQPLRFGYRKAGATQSKQAVGDVVFMEISRSNLDWYVFIRKRGEDVVKTFHLSRFTDAARLESETSPHIPFDPRAALEGAWGIVGATEDCEVTLRFSPEALDWVAYREWPGQLSGNMQGGHYVLKLHAPVHGPDKLPLEFLAWVRGWGPRVEVLSPPHVRTKWLEEAREVLTRYASFSQEGSLP